MPTADLKRFFETKPATKFLTLDRYKSMVAPRKIKQLESFLYKLGVKTTPEILHVSEVGYCRQEKEYFIDGLHEIIEKVANTEDKDLSIFYGKNYVCLLIITH